MDYETFQEAFQHNFRTKEHLINLLKARVDKHPNYALFLGAGASVSSGIKTTGKMIDGWRQSLYATYRGDDDYLVWLAKQDWYEAEDEYSRLFEMVYDQPSQRRVYIEKCVKDAKPNWGYAYLNGLIGNGIFNVVFTTNFDDLVNEACFAFTNELRPMVCAHDSAVSSVRLMSERPKVIKLHGDFLYDSIKNTSSELQSLENNMRDNFAEFAKQYGLVVMGYGGNDQSVMDLLDVLVRSNNYFRNGIYWCLRKGSKPGKRLRQLLRNDRVFWVEVDGFDEIMADIAHSSNISLPQGVLAPHQTALDRVSHLMDTKQNQVSPYLKSALGNLNELKCRVKKALDHYGLGEPLPNDEKDKYSGIKNIASIILPLFKARDLLNDGKGEDCAAICKKTLLEKAVPEHFQKEAWHLLLKALLRNKKQHVEAAQVLLSARKESWIDADYYDDLSYFNLLLGKYDDALMFADRSLELNKGFLRSKINKALALHFLKKPELKKLLTEIKLPGFSEHHQAAAYAIEGNFTETIHFLQRAIVLGKYSVDSACSDVAYRVFWGMNEFEAKLRSVSADAVFKYPYKDACPMSEVEKQIRKKTEKK